MTDARITDRPGRADHTTRSSRRAVLARVGRVVGRWWHRLRTRPELAHLDARMRADIGVRWEDTRAERRKPFWRP